MTTARPAVQEEVSTGRVTEAVVPVQGFQVWGPRLASRDHRMHVYSDPRDQCSLNTQKLNNKSLTSIHTVLHELRPLWSSLEYNIAAEIFVNNLDPCHLP